MKIAVIGPGAIGCLLAARLHAAKADVWLLDHNPGRAAWLAANGILLTSPDGEEKRYRVRCAYRAGDIGPCDVAIVAVKAHQTAAAARHLPALLSGGGMALSLQNGIGNLGHMAAAAGSERLLAGVISAGATLLDWGHVRLAGEGPVVLGIPPGSRVAPLQLRALTDLFLRAGLSCRETSNIRGAMWDKLMVNIGINPLTALLRVPNGVLPSVPEAWELAVAAVEEGVRVARVLRVALGDDPVARVREVCAATAANHSSMLQDVLRGRSTEIGAMNGQIVAAGRKAGVPAPVNSYLTRMIRAVEKTYVRRVEPERGDEPFLLEREVERLAG